MQKSIKILLIVMMMLLMACAAPETVWAAAGDVAINAGNFPDGTFREYVKRFDSNSDGILSQTELSKVTSISANNSNITSLKGVEHFYNLTTLYCYNNKLTSLDMSGNTKLVKLACYGNQLTSLNVTKCAELKELYCYSNKLTSLDVTKNVKLMQLNPKDNMLTTIDVSKNTELVNLCVIRNKITSLDLRNNTKLLYLYCRSNNLKSLDVSKNTNLRKIWIEYNQFACLDLSNNPSVTELLTDDNSYTITQKKNNTFDLSAIPGFKVAMASNWKGATVSGNTLTIDEKATAVTYTYDVDGAIGSKTVQFKFNIANPSKETTYVSSVSVTGVDTPVAGKVLDATAICDTVGVTEKSPAITWEKKVGNTYEKVTGKADYDAAYRAVVTLSPDWYYRFKDDVAGTVNGKNANVSYSSSTGNMELIVEYKTDKKEVASEGETEAATEEFTQDASVQETEEITTEILTQVESEATTEKEAVSIPEEHKGGSNNLWWLWIVLAVIIIALIIFIIFKKRAKDKE